MSFVLKLFLIFMNMLFIAFIIINQTKKYEKVGMYSAVLFASLVYYGFVPFLDLLVGSKDAKGTGLIYLSRISNASALDVLYANLGIIVFLITFVLLYGRVRNSEITNHVEFDKNKLKNFCRLFTWVTFIIGGISFLIYASAMGGISLLLSRAEYLRSFNSSRAEFVSYYISILFVPSKLIVTTPIIVMPLLDKDTRNHKLYRVIFVISFVLAIVFDFTNAGKSGIILLLMCYFIPVLCKKFKHPWGVAIQISLLSIPFLGILDQFFKYLNTHNWDWSTISTDVTSYLQQFSHPFANVVVMGDIVEQYGFRWCRDYITGILNIIPGISFEPTYEVVSKFQAGSNWKILGGTPVDFVTFGYVELGFLGIVISSVLLGYILGNLDNVLSQIESNYYLNVIRVSLITCTFSMMANADVFSIVSGQFQLYLVALCVVWATSNSKMVKIRIR